MKYQLLFICFCLSFTNIWATVSVEQQTSVDGRCRSRTGKLYNVGEEWNDQCTHVRCLRGSNRNEVILQHESCGSISIQLDPGCYSKLDNTLPYPHCCQPKIICKNHGQD